MLCTNAIITSNTIRTQTGAGRTPVWILIRVIMYLTIAFNYRSLYDEKKWIDSQRDAARICCWAPAPAARHPQRARNCQSISPARKALASNPADRRCCCRSMGQTDGPMNGQTDGRTLDRYVDSAPHTMRPASITIMYILSNRLNSKLW